VLSARITIINNAGISRKNSPLNVYLADKVIKYRSNAKNVIQRAIPLLVVKLAVFGFTPNV
jgi:hypothetical protein